MRSGYADRQTWRGKQQRSILHRAHDARTDYESLASKIDSCNILPWKRGKVKFFSLWACGIARHSASFGSRGMCAR